MTKAFKAPQEFEAGAAPFIVMDSIESNKVAKVGYDPETQTLAVTFPRGTGAIYHYPNVEQATYDKFMAAESIGKFFGANIQDLPFKKYRAEAVAA